MSMMLLKRKKTSINLVSLSEENNCVKLIIEAIYDELPDLLILKNWDQILIIFF
jgi:hypothetical protein